MTVAARERRAAGSARSDLPVLLALCGAAAAIEVALLAGVVAPLRLDRNPPSLQTNLARALGEDWRGLAGYVLLCLVLSAAYVLALRLARAAPPRLALAAVAASAVFGLTLLTA